VPSPLPLEQGRYYHIYNRGTNGENLFRGKRNYRYFLQRAIRYIEPIAETFAYCSDEESLRPLDSLQGR